VAARRTAPDDEATELLRTLLIVQLALAGSKQRQICAVARCSSHRVNATLKPLRKLLKSRREEKG